MTVGTAVIPHSSQVAHLRENLNVSSLVDPLTDREMSRLGWPPDSMAEEL